MKTGIAVLLMLLATAIPVNAELETNCVIEDNVQPYLICFYVDDDAHQLQDLFLDPRVTPQTAAAYAGPVMIKPYGYGPIPAYGVGATEACDMYQGMECTGAKGIPVALRTVDVDGSLCINMKDMHFRATTDMPWTTLPYMASTSSC